MLEDKDILQVHATVLTDILVLLTLSNIGGVARAAQRLAGFVAATVLLTLQLVRGQKAFADYLERLKEVR